MCRRTAVLSVLAIFGMGLGIVCGQETTGSIVGTVRDQSGALVPGAQVTILDSTKADLVVRTAITDSDGNFSAPNLPVSTYRVTAQMPNFKKAVKSDVILSVGQRRVVDFTLEVGGIDQVVTVQAGLLAVETTTPTVSTVIDGIQVRELSLNNRNFVQLVTLAAGVTNDLDDIVNTGTNNPDTQVVNRNLISVNGARSTQNTFTVDGADVTDRGSNLTIQAYPSVDSIGEFKVLRSLYPAESGRSGGGQINVITRSGENRFHGSAYEFIRNEAFNANNFVTNAATKPPFGVNSDGKAKRKPFRYNNFGFTFSGPVYIPTFGAGGSWAKRLEKTFFFFSEEQRRDKRYPTLSSVVPDSNLKAGVFPIDICLRATISGSTRTCLDTLPAGSPISSRTTLSSVSQQYVAMIWNNVPDPTTPATYALNYPALNIANFHQEVIKVDHSLTNTISVNYRYQRDTIPTEDADGAIGTRSGIPFVNTTESDSPGRTHTAQVTYTASPTMIFEGRYAYGYGAILINTTGLAARAVSPVSVDLPFTVTRDMVPVMSVSGFNSITGFSNYDNFSWKQNFSGSMAWIAGAGHTLKFGAVISMYRKHENALSGTNQGSFSSFFNTTAGAGTQGSVLAPGIASTSVNNLVQNWANFLMGRNVSFTQSKYDMTADFRQRAIEAYGQDEWRLRPNLALYYGVRYSFFGLPYDDDGKLTNFVPSLWNPADAPQVTGAGSRVAGTGNFCNGLIANTQNYTTGPSVYNCTPGKSPWGKYVAEVSKSDFAPRFGLSWDPFGKGATAIRTGYGIYHEQIPVGALELFLGQNPPYQETITITNTTLDSPVPEGQTPSVVASATVGSLRGVQSDFLTPYMQHWSLDWQQELSRSTMVTVGYYGSKGTHLIGFTEINDLPPGKAINTQCATGSNTLQTPGVVTVPCQVAGTAFTSTPTILDQVRPYRGFRSINMLETRYNSNYHSLQVSAQQRFSGASQVNLAYTWSKNLTDNQTSSVNAAPQDIYNIRAEYGRAVLDRRHVLTLNYVYELPFYRSQAGTAGKVLGGWQLSGIYSYNTGLPFTVTSSSYDPAGIGFIPALVAGGRPNLSCNPNENAPHTIEQWFNTACFEAQTPAGTSGLSNTPGTASRGAVDGPPWTRFDFTLTKNIRVAEGVNVQIRAEAFNLINHTNYRALSTSRALTNTLFGQVTSYRDPRTMQFGIKLSF